MKKLVMASLNSLLKGLTPSEIQAVGQSLADDSTVPPSPAKAPPPPLRVARPSKSPSHSDRPLDKRNAKHKAPKKSKVITVPQLSQKLTWVTKTNKLLLWVILGVTALLMFAIGFAMYIQLYEVPHYRQRVIPQRTNWPKIPPGNCDTTHARIPHHNGVCNPECQFLWQLCQQTNDISEYPSGSTCMTACGLCDKKMLTNTACIAGSLVRPCWPKIPVGNGSVFMIQTAVVPTKASGNTSMALTVSADKKSLELKQGMMSETDTSQLWHLGTNSIAACNQEYGPDSSRNTQVPCPCSEVTQTFNMSATTFNQPGKKPPPDGIQWADLPPADALKAVGLDDPWSACRSSGQSSMCVPCGTSYMSIVNSVKTPSDEVVFASPSFGGGAATLTHAPESFWDRPDKKTPAHIAIFHVDPFWPSKGVVIVDASFDRPEPSKQLQLVNNDGAPTWEMVECDASRSMDSGNACAVPARSDDPKYIWYFVPMKLSAETVALACDANTKLDCVTSSPGIIAKCPDGTTTTDTSKICSDTNKSKSCCNPYTTQTLCPTAPQPPRFELCRCSGASTCEGEKQCFQGVGRCTCPTKPPSSSAS